MKTFQRIVLVLITALVVLIFYVPVGRSDYAGTWKGGTYGVDAGRSYAGVVDAVAPGSPADLAGIRPGDRVLVTPFSKDYPRFAFPRAGERATFTLRRPDGSTYTVTMTAIAFHDFTRISQVFGILAMIPATIFVAIAFILVFLRPSVMTWSFYAYATGFLSTQPSIAFYQSYLHGATFTVLSFLLNTVWGNFAVLPLLPFILRFPDDRLTGFNKAFDRGLWIAIVLAFDAYVYEWVSYEQGTVPSWSVALDTWLPLATFVLATLILVQKYKHATPQMRQRLGFLTIGLIVSFVAYAVYFIPSVPRSVAEIVGFGVVIMPISVMYAVLKHRVIDINFVLNRALVYGILSVFVISFVSLLDWFAGHVIAGERLATGIELVLTIAVGFLLDRINRAVSNGVDLIFFRERRAAEDYIRRAARALPYATDESAINDSLVQIPDDALKLSAAALTVARRTAIASKASRHRRTRRSRRPASTATTYWYGCCNRASSGCGSRNCGTPRPRAGKKLRIRRTGDRTSRSRFLHALRSASNGSQLDPDEVELLEELAREASRAYDHIEAVRMRERYAGLAATAPA